MHAILIAGVAGDSLPHVARMLQRRAPDLPLIQALTVPDFERTRLAQAAGIHYTLLWPQELPGLPGLLSSYHASSGYPAQGRGGQAIGLYSPRGGVGLSTTAILLAAAAAWDLEQEVLLVDMDIPWGGLEALLQLRPEQDLGALHGLLCAGDIDAERLRSATTPHPTGLQLLASPAGGAPGDAWTGDLWAGLIRAARDTYPLSVWRMPPELGPGNDPGVWSAMDEVLVVVSPAFSALERTRRLLDQLAGWVAGGTQVGLIVNQDGLDPTARAGELAAVLGAPLRGAIRDDRRLRRLGLTPAGLPVTGRRLKGAAADALALYRRLIPAGAAAPRGGR